MNGSFFYVIETSHYVKFGNDLKPLLGYGITTNPKKRTKQYSDHSGVEQEFINLYFGPTQQIKALESMLKHQVASDAHKIYGQPVEWISPKSPLNTKKLVDRVNKIITNENFSIHSLKDDYLPFNNLDHHRKITVKELNANPDQYLVSKVDKKRKKTV